MLNQLFRQGLRIVPGLMAFITVLGLTIAPSWALTFPPTQKGAPARTAGGGVRDPKETLTALLPEDGIHSFVSDRAMLFVHVPKGLSQDAILVIYRDDETLFEQEFTLPESEGLVGIQVPASAIAAMPFEQLYDWEFAVFPNGDTQLEEQVIQGQLQRVRMKDQDIAGAPLSMAEHFSRQGVWQETLQAIAPIHSNYPTEWQSLLESVSLDDLGDVTWVGQVELTP